MKFFIIILSLLSTSCFSSVTTNSIDVSDFGAAPNDGIDDGPAIQAAIDYAKKYNLTEVKFERGQYDISPQYSDYHLKITSMKNFKLQGALSDTFDISEPQTKLIFQDITKAGIELSSNITTASNFGGRAIEFNGFVIDYKHLPFAVVLIKSVSGKKLTVSQTQGLALSNPAYLNANQPFGVVGWHYASSTNYAYNVVTFPYGSTWIKSLSGTQYELTASSIPSDSYAAAGRQLIILARDYRYPTLFLYKNSGGVIVKNVTIHSSPGVASLWGLNEGWMHAINFQIKPRDSYTQLSTNADGIHAFGNRAGIYIYKSFFQGMADDAINLHGRGVYTSSSTYGYVVNSNTIKIRYDGTNDYRAGDKLVLMKKSTAARVQNVTVKNASYDKSTGYFIISLSTSLNSTAQTNFTGLLIFNEDVSTSNSTITGNTFSAFRGRATVLRGHNIYVTNNYSNDLLYNFSVIEATTSWQEGPYPYNISFSGNNITSIDPSINNISFPLVYSQISTDSGLSSAKEISGIYVSESNNYFNNKKGKNILLLNTK